MRRTALAALATRAAPISGNARIGARDQTRFFLHLHRLLPRPRALQGRLGSGTGSLDHQVALLTRGDERLAVAVLTAGNGSHAVGEQTLEGVFRRLLRGR